MLPFYGRFDHFREAVTSVLNQSDPDWRLIIIDDVYPDPAPGEWAQALGDERIAYIRNTENLRPSRNYNKAIGLMEADFAVIMGCDDIMLPEYVARVRELTTSFPEASVIQPGVEVIDGEGAVYEPLADRIKARIRFDGYGARSFAGEELVTSLLRGNWTYFPSLVWNVKELKSRSFRTDLDVVQDLSMLLSIFFAGGSLVLDDTIVFQYRRHATSLSAKTGPDGSKFIQERTVFAEAAEEATKHGWSRARRAARTRFTSRANALSELPSALKARSMPATRSLSRHIFGS